MEEELDQLKLVLRSLVVSSPTRIDARTLLRDYRNMVGSQIPMAKFGYKDPITFLRERFSDCFLGFPDNPELTLIVPDDLKHVDKFVQKQRVASTVKYKGKRRSVQACTVRPRQDLIASTFGNGRQSSPKQQVSSTSRTYINGTLSTKFDESIKLTSASTNNNGKLATPRQVTSPEQSSRGRKESLRDDHDSGRLTASSSSSESKRTQLEELKREVRDLVKEHPDGVWCTDLIRLYRERHGRELQFTRFGFTSVLSLAGAADGVAVAQDAARGDWLLSDAARAAPAPGPAPRAAPRPARRAPSRAASRTTLVDPDEALPGIPYGPGVFPEDCLGPLDSIPAASLAGIAPGDMLEVVVGEVYSPSHFWLQRLGEEHNIAMEELMDEMNVYYERREGRARTLMTGAVRVGVYCACRYDGDWHRSLIVRIMDAETVKVRHVDYGTVERCAARELRPLRRGWGALPAQAVRARLAGARPVAGARRWSRCAAHRFLDLVRDRRLVATVTAVDDQEDALEVVLIDTSTDDDRCIATELIGAGHAERRCDSALGTSECYLFPHFEALECGATPNFAEVHAYLRDGIELDFVEEYRAHVPPSLPPLPRAPPSTSSDEDAAPRPPPPPPPPPPPAVDCGAVTLTASELHAYVLLSRLAPDVGERYLLDTVNRAMTAAAAAATAAALPAGPAPALPPGFPEPRQ